MRKSYKRKAIGFTLIEMLVAVLVIGILAAILVYHYQHVVLQSRFSTLIPIAKNIADAQETYFMRRGRYATSFEGLNVKTTTSTNKISVAFSEEEDFKFVMLSHADVPHAYYVIYLKNSKNFPNNIHCEARTDDEDAMWLCEEGMDGKKIEQGSLKGNGYTDFVLQGNPESGRFSKIYYNTSEAVLFHGDTCVASGGSGCNSMEVSEEASCVVEQGGSGCSNSTFTDNSVCEAQQGSGASCQNSTFTNNSICSANSSDSCSGSEFSSSSCYASGGNNTCGAGSTFTNGSVCYGETSGTSRAGTSCGNSTYVDSTCRADAAQGYVCGASSYDNSVCYGGKYGGCGGASTYSNHSICYGNGATACDKSTFKSNSACYAYSQGACGNNVFENTAVCYAHAKGSCVGKNGNSGYKTGSYCAGEYCPVGSPKQDGGTWQACPNAGNSGKTC